MPHFLKTNNEKCFPSVLSSQQIPRTPFDALKYLEFLIRTYGEFYANLMWSEQNMTYFSKINKHTFFTLMFPINSFGLWKFLIEFL